MKRFALCSLMVFTWACAATAPRVEQPPTTTAEPAPAEAVTAVQAPERIEVVMDKSRPLIDNLLAAYNSRDYDAYSRDFSQSLKNTFPDRKAFAAQLSHRHETYGLTGSRGITRFVRQRNAYSMSCWVGFSKLPEPATLDATLVKAGSTLQIEALSFEFPDTPH